METERAQTCGTCAFGIRIEHRGLTDCVECPVVQSVMHENDRCLYWEPNDDRS